jgi:hypothetical protein
MGLRVTASLGSAQPQLSTHGTGRALGPLPSWILWAQGVVVAWREGKQ